MYRGVLSVLDMLLHGQVWHPCAIRYVLSCVDKHQEYRQRVSRASGECS
jgi:hypothetical protein